MMSLLTESRARKQVTETRRRTPPAVFRPELHNRDHRRQEIKKINRGNYKLEYRLFNIEIFLISFVILMTALS